jgi:DNA-binding transcriptional LysR family regulator
MELYQLRTFVAVAEEGSITGAGKRIHATQPAVSAHIKALEDELGVRLFDRVPRGVELTQAGAELVQDAIEVLSAAQTLQARAVTLGGEVAGQVGLGLCSDPQFLKVSPLLSLLSERFPKLSLSLIQASSGLILNDIRSRELDAGFVFFGVPYRDLEAIKLAEPEYAIMGAAQWKPLLDKGDSETLSEFTWVMPPSHCPFRGLELDILKRHNISPQRTIGSDSEEVIRPLIVEGKALALVREDEGAELTEAGLAVECTPVGRHPVELNFVYRKGDEQNPSIVALIEIVRRTWGV